MAYSSVELQEFKELIERKLSSAMETYTLIMDEISKNNNSAESTNWQAGSIDEIHTSKEEQNILAAKQKKFIDSLQGALHRIENRTYGICRISGEIIPKERLMAVPHATTIISAKN